MKLKVLLVAFLCILSTSIICNAAKITLNAPQAGNYKAFGHAVHAGYLITNGTEPTGDPIGDDGWPTKT